MGADADKKTQTQRPTMNVDTIATIILAIFLVSCILVSYLVWRGLRRWGIARIQGSPSLGGQTAKMRDVLRGVSEDLPPPENKVSDREDGT